MDREQASYGVEWARQTGRLPTAIEQGYDTLSEEIRESILRDIIRDCKVIADVPRYLIKYFLGDQNEEN